MLKKLISSLNRFKAVEAAITKLEPEKTYMLVFPNNVSVDDLAQVGEFLKTQRVVSIIVQADSLKIIELE